MKNNKKRISWNTETLPHWLRWKRQSRIRCIIIFLIIGIIILIHPKNYAKQKHSESVSCHALRLIHQDYSGVICQKSNTQGYIEINHINCLTEFPYNISEENGLVNRVMNTIGPDEFTVIIRGPELARLSQEYLGNCRYRFPFNIYLGGLYTLSVVIVHEKFDAIQETHDVRPTALNLELAQNASWHQPGRDFSPGDWAQNASCSIMAAHEGRWLHVDKSPVSQLYSTDLSSFLSSQYNVQCDETYFYHRSCSLGPVESLINYRRTCKPKKNLRILISGDSQSRHTYVALINRFSGKSPRPFEKFDSEIAFLPRLNMTIIYKNDIFLYKLLNQTIDQINQHDAVLCNTAQWPASSAESGGHWTFAQYRHRVDQVRDQIQEWNHQLASKQKSTKIIWQSLNPFPPWWLYTHPGHKDWRTYTRLQMWNKYANKAMTFAEIPVTGNFELLAPMICRSYDAAHYKGDELELTLDEIIYKLDICE